MDDGQRFHRGTARWRAWAVSLSRPLPAVLPVVAAVLPVAPGRRLAQGCQPKLTCHVGEEPVVAPSAHKHGVTEEALLHALAHPVLVFALDEGFTMLIGADPAGRLLEVGVVEGHLALVVVHAMPARDKYLR